MEGFLIELNVTIDFVMKGKQHSLLNPEKIPRIVSIHIDWAKRIIVLKEACKTTFEFTDDCSNFQEAWQTRFGKRILEEFWSF